MTAWDYDAAGRVITTTYPTGEAVRTAYNLRGLPTGVTGLDAYLVDAAYNAAGQPLWQDWGNTRRTTYAYDTETLRLQSLQVSGNLLDLAYTYDDVGNLRTITDAGNAGQVQTFTYDARDRLLTAHTTAAGQGQCHETYGYDLMGNIITRTVGGDPRTYTYGRPPDPGEPVTPTLPHVIYLPIIAYKHDSRVSTIRQPFAVVATSEGFRAAYDLNGNMTLRVEVSGTETITGNSHASSSVGITFTQEWNAENRLSVVTNTVSGDVTRFVYDGDGNRVLREQPDGSVTAYLGAVEVTLSGTERLTTSYYFAGAQRIAMRGGVTLTYLHGDHLGSASLATDAGGAQVSAMRYTPFGETRYGDAPTDFRFTGQREEGFGLYDYGARFYSPGLGRFVSADVIVPEPGNSQNFNRYAYVDNNPLRYTDPTGHDPLGPEWQREFWLAHRRRPTDLDRQYRLFSLAYQGPVSGRKVWTAEDWNYMGQYHDEVYNDISKRSYLENFAAAVYRLSQYYEDGEGAQFVSGLALLYAGWPYDPSGGNISDMFPSFNHIETQVGAKRYYPDHGMENFASYLYNGENTHHYVGHLVLGYHWGRQLNTQAIRYKLSTLRFCQVLPSFGQNRLWSRRVAVFCGVMLKLAMTPPIHSYLTGQLVNRKLGCGPKSVQKRAVLPLTSKPNP